MRVLVTGGSGFTGEYLLAELVRRGHKPVSIEADVTDRVALAAAVEQAVPDSVVHLAAKAFIGSDDFGAFYRVNQLGTFNLLDAMSRHAPKAQVLLVSSANIYGNQAKGLLSEDCPPQPVNHYAISKWAMEVGAAQWFDKLPITIVRPFNYTGVGQEARYLIPKIVDHFKRRAPVIELGNLDVERDFGDVRSVVSAYCDLLLCPAAVGKTYNVSTGQPHSLRDILARAADLTGHNMNVRVDPDLVRANEVRMLAGDPSRLRAVLKDWQTVPLEETLRWMLG